jgi:hypothetical protein
MPPIITLIETDSNPLSTDSSKFSNNYNKEGALVLDNIDEW